MCYSDEAEEPYVCNPLAGATSGKNSWRLLRGFDGKEQVWRELPPFKYPIPAPDPDLFKDFHVAGDDGLFCVNVGKANEAEELYVCNLFTGDCVLRFIQFQAHSDDDGMKSNPSFWVIAIGSAAIGTENLSRKTEVYESALGEWLSAGYVPGTDFLNDYQTGVCCESQDLLLSVGFMVNCSKGILAFDVGKRKWRDDWICPFFQPHPITDTALTVYFAIAQVVICSGVVYLFSEQEATRKVTHCIDRLDLEDGGGFRWTRVATHERQGGRGLLVYPEYTCVAVEEHKLCIFNTIERACAVLNMANETPLTPLIENGIRFHSLNPVGYPFKPSFRVWLMMCRMWPMRVLEEPTVLYAFPCVL